MKSQGFCKVMCKRGNVPLANCPLDLMCSFPKGLLLVCLAIVQLSAFFFIVIVLIVWFPYFLLILKHLRRVFFDPSVVELKNKYRGKPEEHDLQPNYWQFLPGVIMSSSNKISSNGL